MTFRTRIRKIVKWTALGIAVLLSAAFAANDWYSAVCVPLPATTISIDGGCIVINRYEFVVGNSNWFKLRRHEYGEPFDFWFESKSYPKRIPPGGTSALWMVKIPLWVASLAAGGIGLWAWKLDRTATLRARNNFCKKCGYHRAGLKPDALCPECGVGVKA